MTSEEREVLDRLVRIETKLDGALLSDADHETRIRRLERGMWLAAGAGLVGGGGLGALAAQLIGA